MSKWTRQEILNRIRFGGEDPAALGRAGGKAAARKRPKKQFVSKWSSAEIQNMPWNKD